MMDGDGGSEGPRAAPRLPRPRRPSVRFAEGDDRPRTRFADEGVERSTSSTSAEQFSIGVPGRRQAADEKTARSGEVTAIKQRLQHMGQPGGSSLALDQGSEAGVSVDDLPLIVSEMSVAAQRWHRAVTLVLEAQRMQWRADTLNDPAAKPADKFAAAVWLALQNSVWARLLASNPHKALLRKYIAKKRAGQYSSLWDRIDTELYLTGALVFAWCTPANMDEHWLVFTPALFFVEWVVFFFMAAQHPYFLAHSKWQECSAAAAAASGSSLSTACEGMFATDLLDWRYMTAWIAPPHSGTGANASSSNSSSSSSSSAYQFSFTFLRNWGGRYGPDLAAGQSYRWFSAQFVHADFQHVLSNMLLFVALGSMMEIKYGSARVLLIWFCAMLGGGLLSMALENPCIQVVGASGGVFGLFGLFIADMLGNFETVQRPILRSLCILGFLGYFLYTAFSQSYTSHISHIGGLVCGLFPAFLCLPNLLNERWEAMLPLMGVLAVVGVYVVLPSWLYAVQFKGLAEYCGL